MEWEEDGEEAVGSGGALLYAVGDEVEVRMDDPGFHGAFYEATVSARLACSGRYEVMCSTLVEGTGGRRGGGPLRETVAAGDLRPRPPPPPLGRDLNVFDMVEAYQREGWWPGMVSAAWPERGRKVAVRYTVSFPSCREEAVLPASLVRRRRAFVRGRWMDAREVVPRVPRYDEGSNVEVMLNKGKHRAAWMTATVIKMVSSINYVVRLKNKEGSVDIVDCRYIRPQPIFDRKKFEYELEPSAEVEVNLGGAWSLGVISDVGSCGYGVRLKGHDSSDEEDYMLVSRALLRPCYKQDDQELMPCAAKKNARKRNHNVSTKNSLSTVSSTSSEDNDQYSSVPNKIARIDTMQKEDQDLSHSIHPRQDKTGLLLKCETDVEAPLNKQATRLNKLENEKDIKGKACMLVSRKLPKLGCTGHGGKRRRGMKKEFASTSLNLSCISAPEDAVEIKDKSSYVDLVEISDNSGYDIIHISDDSSCNPKRKKRRQNFQEEELHSRHISCQIQESQSMMNISPARSPLNCDLLLDVMRHPKVQPCNHVLSPAFSLLEIPQVQSNHNAGQLFPLPSNPALENLPVKVLSRMNETKETNHVHLQAEFLAPDDCTTGDQNCDMPIKVEVKSWVADISKKEADTSLTTSKISMQTVTDSGEDNSRRPRPGDSDIPISSKLEPYLSEQQGVEVDLSCMPMPNNITVNSIPLVTSHTFQFVSLNKLDVPEGQKKAPDALEMNSDTVDFSPKEQAHCNLEIFSTNSEKKIIDASHYECYASLQQHPLGRCQVPNDWNVAGQSSFVHPKSITMNLSTILPAPNSTSHPTTFASNLLMGPCGKMEVFEKLPQVPHFGKLTGCPPELREGKALGLMASFANIAESIQNIRIQDEENVFEEKQRCLSELEEDGFDVRALKERLENLLCIKNRQRDLKKNRARLDQGILEREVENAAIEQNQKLLEKVIKELELKILEYQEKKASLVEKKAANCLEIAKLQGDMDRIEESFLSAKYDFHTTATAPW